MQVSFGAYKFGRNDSISNHTYFGGTYAGCIEPVTTAPFEDGARLKRDKGQSETSQLGNNGNLRYHFLLLLVLRSQPHLNLTFLRQPNSPPNFYWVVDVRFRYLTWRGAGIEKGECNTILLGGDLPIRANEGRTGVLNHDWLRKPDASESVFKVSQRLMLSSLSAPVGFTLAQQRAKRKYRRIFFATDLHSSEIVFRRFIGAAKFYEADALIMGGDVTGKNTIPLVKGADGKYHFNFLGQEFRGIAEEQLLEYETRIMNSGIYSYRVTEGEYESVRSDSEKVSAVFDRLMIERLNNWAALAKQHLEPLGVKCYWTGGNDDHQRILESVKQNDFFVNVEEKVIPLDEEHEMLSFGWSNPTPWKTPRECDETELASRLEKVTSQVHGFGSCVYNIHPPPFDSTLDIAAKLDTSFDPPKPVTSGGNAVWIPVGSTAVREVIEKTQPLLMLCGHIHETKNAAKIGRTTCINPGSEYGAGILRGVIVNLQKDKVLSYQFTSG